MQVKCLFAALAGGLPCFADFTGFGSPIWFSAAIAVGFAGLSGLVCLILSVMGLVARFPSTHFPDRFVLDLWFVLRFVLVWFMWLLLDCSYFLFRFQCGSDIIGQDLLVLFTQYNFACIGSLTVERKTAM